MIARTNSSILILCESVSEKSSLAVFIVGCLVLIGWILDIQFLKSLYPNMVIMKANTALSFIMIGASLWLLQIKRSNKRIPLIAQVCSGAAASIGFLTIGEYLFGYDLGIDQILFTESPQAVGSSAPGRMGFNTALNLSLIGLSLFILSFERQSLYRLSQSLAAAAALVVLAAFIGYLFGAKSLFGIAFYTKMPMHTGLAFIVICIGILCARPYAGLMTIITSEGIGGILARCLIFPAIAIPLLIAWLRLIGQRAGFYGTEFGLSLYAISNIVVFILLILWAARLLDRIDAERKEMEKEIKKLNKNLQSRASQLEAANKELEAFSYTVSHDLRAPLITINGFSQALIEKYTNRLDIRGKDYINSICSAAQRMGQLIDDLLSFSRVTRSEIHHEKVDLSALANTIASDLRKIQPERKLEFIIAPGLVTDGDVRLLRIALENLLGNSWKFTGKCPEARIEFGAAEKQGRPAYFVRDNGAGFDMAYAGKLFGAFQRLHGTTEFPGTGIGLATVQRIIHRHGGDVWAEGKVGQGATLYFTISPY
jgi:signal transduction histidine kinase